MPSPNKSFRDRADEIPDTSRALSTLPLPAISWDSQRRVTGWNSASERLFGLKGEDARGREVCTLLYPQSSQHHARRKLAKVLDGSGPLMHEDELSCGSGMPIICELSHTVTRDADGAPSLVVSVIRDVTAERQARLMSERLYAIASAANSYAELDDILLLIRNAVIEVCGFDRAGVWVIDGDNIRGSWGTDQNGVLRDERHLRETRNDWGVKLLGVWNGEYGYYTETHANIEIDGRIFDEFTHAVVGLIARGEIVGLISVDNLLTGRPITEERVEAILAFGEQAAIAIQNARLFKELSQAQDALIRIERMRAVGELAGGVAHNVKNLLVAVLGYAELIEQSAEATPQIRDFARIIIKAVDDGKRISHRLEQAIHSKRSIQFSACDLSEIARDALEFTHGWRQAVTAGSGNRIEICTDLETAIFIDGAPSELREVAVNLIKNAVEAMPGGGRLTVRTFAEHGHALMEVTDTGLGMSDETRKRLFEPFYSTRSSDLGVGLGLAVSWGIVHRHVGEIEVDSAMGRGTTVTVVLPLAGNQ